MTSALLKDISFFVHIYVDKLFTFSFFLCFFLCFIFYIVQVKCAQTILRHKVCNEFGEESMSVYWRRSLSLNNTNLYFFFSCWPEVQLVLCKEKLGSYANILVKYLYILKVKS